jgi:hypothetical protein
LESNLRPAVQRFCLLRAALPRTSKNSNRIMNAQCFLLEPVSPPLYLLKNRRLSRRLYGPRYLHLEFFIRAADPVDSQELVVVVTLLVNAYSNIRQSITAKSVKEPNEQKKKKKKIIRVRNVKATN